MSTKVIIAAGAIAFGLSASAAQAVTYTFDFSSLGSDHSTLYVASNEDAGFGVTIVGRHYGLSGGSYVEGGEIDVDTNSYGLISKNSYHESHTIDSWGADESMKFTFDDGKLVSLANVVISWFSGTGDYDVFADGAHAGHTSDGAVVPAGPANVFAIGTRTIETDYCISYRWDGSCKAYKKYDSGIKIKSLTVEYTPGGGGGVIPLPAAGWLLIGALGGLGALRRRKS